MLRNQLGVIQWFRGPVGGDRESQGPKDDDQEDHGLLGDHKIKGSDPIGDNNVTQRNSL